MTASTRGTSGEVQEKVEEYIQDAPDFARPICVRLREIIFAAEPEMIEEWKWNAPVYS